MVWNAFSSNHLACRIVARAPSRSLTSTKGTEKIKIFNRIKSEKFELNGKFQWPTYQAKGVAWLVLREECHKKENDRFSL